MAHLLSLTPPALLAWSLDLQGLLPYVWWTLTILLMAVGLIGTVIPLLPGSTIILAGAVLHRLLIVKDHTISWWTVGGLATLTLVSYGVELASGTVGAKWFGATRWGAIGGIIGTVVGLFSGLIGVFIFPLVGVLVGELLGGKGIAPATKSTWGTVIGAGAGIVANFIIGLTMIGWFLLAAFR